MWHQARTPRFVLACLLGTSIGTAAAPVWSTTRFRISNARILQVLSHGVERSPSLRELMATLESIERDVDIEPSTCEPDASGLCPHALPEVAATLVRIRVDAREPLQAAVGRLAHGLYHGLEIARERSVVDARSRRALFARIGERSCHDDSERCWETRAARAFEALVIRELSGLEPTFDLNIGFTSPGVERVASGLLKASPTFRRQCAVVGALENLAVVIGGPRGRMPMQVRARTELRRYAGGSVLAIVELPTLASAAMLAHEFEHVLEYMERHQQATPDVAERGDFRAGRYPSESERALLAERAAAREIADRDPVRRRAEDLLKGLLRSWPAAR